jgi:hypothetical protein
MFKEYIIENTIQEDLLRNIEEKCSKFITELKGTGKKDFLYRGHKTRINEYSIMKPHKEGRIPRNTPKELHQYINKSMRRKFGWNTRDGVFVTFNQENCVVYGLPYLFFPIGKYRYVYSRVIEDLYTDVSEVMALFDDEELKYFKGPAYMLNYGPGGKGAWYYGNMKAKSKNEEEAYKELFGVEYDKRKGQPIDKKFKWIADVSFTDYLEKIKNDNKAKAFEEIDDIVQTYTQKNLGYSLGNEISFDCNEYYLVNPKHSNLLRKEIFDK